MGHLPSYSDTLYADIQPSYIDCLYHHGIKGQKWGVRRFQNADGSLTSAGKSRVKTNAKKRGNNGSSAVGAAVLLGVGVVAPLAIGAYGSYMAESSEFDGYADALTGSAMKRTIDSTKARGEQYKQSAAYFNMAYAQGDGASYAETRPIAEAVKRDRRVADSSLLEAKRALKRMESKTGLLKSKKRQDALERARAKVDELDKTTSDFRRSADLLEKSMASANWKYYDSEFASRGGRKTSGSSNGSSSRSTNNSSRSTDGDRRSTRYGRKSTAQTKSKDRVADMKSRGVKVGTVEEESKRVRDLSSRIQQAQREGKDTTQMVQDLQDARARKKIAVERESMQHGFVCMCRRSRVIL